VWPALTQSAILRGTWRSFASPLSQRPCVPLRIADWVSVDATLSVSRIILSWANIGPANGKHNKTTSCEQLFAIQVLHNIARASVSPSFDSLAYNDDFQEPACSSCGVGQKRDHGSEDLGLLGASAQPVSELHTSRSCRAMHVFPHWHQ
jgi:hypothetical protein